MLAKLVDEKNTFGNVKNMLRKNVFPVSLDGIQYDGVIKPPLVASVSQVGLRPKGFATEVSSLLLRIPLSCVQIVADVVITEEPALSQHGRF